jgi:hypothetical protein
MFVYVYSVFVLGSGLAIGWLLIQGVLPTVLDLETEVKQMFHGGGQGPIAGCSATEKKIQYSIEADLGFLSSRFKGFPYKTFYAFLIFSPLLHLCPSLPHSNNLWRYQKS